MMNHPYNVFVLLSSSIFFLPTSSRLFSQSSIMPSYFLPYPKTQHKNQSHQKSNHRSNVDVKNKPYPHPQPDPDPSKPPSPLNLSPTDSPISSSGSSTIKPAKYRKSVHWKQDYHPSILKLKIVCGDPEDPSLVVVFGLQFREGKRPKVRFGVRRGHGRTVELGDDVLDGERKEEQGGERDIRGEKSRVEETGDRNRGEETRGRKRRRGSRT